MNFSTPESCAAVRTRLYHDSLQIPHPELPDPCVVPRSHFCNGRIAKDYVSIRFNNVRIGGHVAAFGLKYGRLPHPGMEACHLCDNPACVQEAHMVEGSPRENMRQAVERHRIARGARHGSKTHPERVPRGEKNRMAKMTEEQAAQIKWCLDNPAAWFTDDVSAAYEMSTALAIAYDVTVPSIRQIRSGANWSQVTPAKPGKLPFADGIVVDLKVKSPQRPGVLSVEQVRRIRAAYHETDEHRYFVRRMAEEYKVTNVSIRNVLQRKTYQDVANEIPAVHETGHGMADLTNRDVQIIRATFEKYGADVPLKGLLAALGRYFDCGVSHIRNIIERLNWLDVQDDPTAFLQFHELEFKELTQRGANHPLSKLADDEAAYTALRRMYAGESKAKLAKDLRVSVTVMYSLFHGKTWKHVWDRYHAENPSKTEISGDAQ